MRLFFLWFILSTSLYGTILTGTLLQPSLKATVGTTTGLTFILPQAPFTKGQIEAFLNKSAFFSKNDGIAQLDQVTFDPSSKALKIQFRPKGVGQGLCMLPPISVQGDTLLWPAFQYEFQLPPAASFNEPLLDTEGHPIPIVHDTALADALSSFITNQRDGFASKQLHLMIVLNGLFICLLLTYLIHLFMKRFAAWKVEYEQRLADRKTNVALLKALRERIPDWELLHKYLVKRAEKESGEKVERTPQELALYFKEKKQETLSQSALMIHQYAYLPHADFEAFQKAFPIDLL